MSKVTSPAARVRTYLFLAVACLFIPSARSASIILASGQVQSQILPASLAPGAYESNVTAAIFLEQGEAPLPSDLAIDSMASGSYSVLGSMTPGIIHGGTVVTDFLLHADPVYVRGTNFIGSITFSAAVLGVIVNTATLNASDPIFEVGGVIYPPQDDLVRGLDFHSGLGDEFGLSDDRRTLTFNLWTQGNIDEFRIIVGQSAAGATVESVGTPEPGTLGLIFAALSLLLLAKHEALLNRLRRAA